MSTFFEAENFKIVIDFSDVTGLSDYVATTLPGEQYIQTVNTETNDGNRGDNPLGNMCSGRCYVSLFDNDDTVNPMNELSVYAGYMTPGRKATVYKSADGENWTRYFGGIITNWQGSFKDGLHNVTTLTIEDDLNSIGMMDVSNVVYTGATAAAALAAIFTAYGLISSDYVIDSSLNSIPYSQLKSLARQTINDICYRALAYIQIKQDGKIYVKPLIQAAPQVADYELTGNDIGPLTPINTSAVNFNKVKITYTTEGGLAYQLIASQTDIEILNGINNIVLDSLAKIYSIEGVSVTIDEEDAPQEYNDITYTAGDNNITVTIDATLDNAKTCRIDVYGLVEGGTQTKAVIIDLPNSSTGSQAETFEYNSNSIMNQTTATTLANRIAAYIEDLRKQIKIQTSFATPDLEVSDTVELSGISATYDGLYRVSAVSLEYGETYNVGFTLLKIS
mgnify:CR=1 FL=1